MGYIEHLSPEHKERAIEAIVEEFDSKHKPGGFFEARLMAAAQEETWRLHAQIRELKDRVRELELERERRVEG